MIDKARPFAIVNSLLNYCLKLLKIFVVAGSVLRSL